MVEENREKRGVSSLPKVATKATSPPQAKNMEGKGLIEDCAKDDDYSDGEFERRTSHLSRREKALRRTQRELVRLRCESIRF